MGQDIDLDSLLEHINEADVKLYHSTRGTTLELCAGGGDRVLNDYFDKETLTLHLTLEFYQGIRTDQLERMYRTLIPKETKAIIVDEAWYSKPTFLLHHKHGFSYPLKVHPAKK